VERQKRAPVERNNVVRGILGIVFEGTAMAKRLSIATRSGETNPMRLVVGRLAGVVKGLISGAIVGDDLTFVVDLFAMPLLRDRQLAGCASSSASRSNVRWRSASIALRIWFVVQFDHCSVSRSKAREDGSLYLMSVSNDGILRRCCD
jgi:hypothetical protein